METVLEPPVESLELTPLSEFKKRDLALKELVEKPLREKILAIAIEVDRLRDNATVHNVMVQKALTDCSLKIRKIANGPLE